MQIRTNKIWKICRYEQPSIAGNKGSYYGDVESYITMNCAKLDWAENEEGKTRESWGKQMKREETGKR